MQIWSITEASLSETHVSKLVWEKSCYHPSSYMCLQNFVMSAKFIAMSSNFPAIQSKRLTCITCSLHWVSHGQRKSPRQGENTERIILLKQLGSGKTGLPDEEAKQSQESKKQLRSGKLGTMDDSRLSQHHLRQDATNHVISTATLSIVNP